MVLPQMIVDLTDDNKHRKGHGIDLFCICGEKLYVTYTMVCCPRCKKNYIIEGARFCPHPRCNKLIEYSAYYSAIPARPGCPT